MPDYIYLLENRLSADQQHALRQLREAAREAGMILFLTGDAVRDLTSGHAVRDLEVAVHGNALKLKKTIEKLGGKVWGEDEAFQDPLPVFSGHRSRGRGQHPPLEYPKAGQAGLSSGFHPGRSAPAGLYRQRHGHLAQRGIVRAADGPLNGAADIEARTLRLVSNYGFLEEPSLLIRATRYMARLGWELDPRPDPL
jgi:tRNA nucleotidyltransferase (CCA-adding enzyme)